jgi:hypothetical protein
MVKVQPPLLGVGNVRWPMSWGRSASEHPSKAGLHVGTWPYVASLNDNLDKEQASWALRK